MFSPCVEIALVFLSSTKLVSPQSKFPISSYCVFRVAEKKKREENPIGSGGTTTSGTGPITAPPFLYTGSHPVPSRYWAGSSGRPIQYPTSTGPVVPADLAWLLPPSLHLFLPRGPPPSSGPAHPAANHHPAPHLGCRPLASARLAAAQLHASLLPLRTRMLARGRLRSSVDLRSARSHERARCGRCVLPGPAVACMTALLLLLLFPFSLSHLFCIRAIPIV
jgi:hypothetical protein